MALCPISIIVGSAGHRENSLRVSSFGRLEERVVILDGLEDLGVPVGRLDEAGTLALEDRLGAGGGGVDERDDLETGTELVLESERVAADEVSDILTCVHGVGLVDSLPRTLVRTKHDVPGTDHDHVKVRSGLRGRGTEHCSRCHSSGSDIAGGCGGGQDSGEAGFGDPREERRRGVQGPRSGGVERTEREGSTSWEGGEAEHWRQRGLIEDGAEVGVHVEADLRV